MLGWRVFVVCLDLNVDSEVPDVVVLAHVI